MKYKSYIGKQVLCGNNIIVFITEYYEAKSDAECAALDGALDVSREQQAKKTGGKDNADS